MNTSLFFALYNLTHQSHVFETVVFLVAQYGDLAMIVTIAIALVVFFIHDKDWKRRRWIEWGREVMAIGISVVIPWLITVVLKAFFHMPRPFVTFLQIHPLVIETPYTSFPSGHATVFFALATVVFFYHKRLGYFFFFCATLIALSRVFAGVHYPLDVVMGALIGVVAASLVHVLILKKSK